MNKYDEIMLPTELDDVIDKGVKQAMMMKHTQKLGRVKKVGIGLAAGLTITLGLGFANPALAAQIPFLGRIFEQIEKRESQYATYSKHANEVSQTVTSNGLTVTLSEMTCDGLVLYASYVIESEEPFEHGDKVGQQFWLYPSSISSYFELYGGQGALNGTYVDDHTFIGMTSYRLAEGVEALPETFEFNVTFNTLEQVNLYEELDEGQVEPRIIFMPSSTYYEGEWDFSTRVTVDQSIVEQIDVSKVEKTRISILEVVKTPLETKITIDYGNMDPFAFDTLIVDENGEQVTSILPADFPQTRQVTYHLPAVGEEMDTVRVLVYRVSVQDEKSEWRGTEYMEYTDSEVWFDADVPVK